MIPVSQPVIGEEEVALVADAVRSGRVSSSGPYVAEFEHQWAAYCRRRHGIAVSNGTAALHLAVEALGLGPGDEVIMPTFTIISCALAVVRAGAIPVLVDADPGTWCMDVGQVADAVTSRTRAIMPVHIYGHPVDMDPIVALADRHGFAIIEDAAEAPGAEYQSGRGDWRRCGEFGTASTFSFYANKPITTGEGGMVVTDDDAVAARLRSLRDLGFSPTRRFLHHDLGYNYRLTNLQAALGVAQLKRLDDGLARKRAVAGAYRACLAGVQGITLQAERPWARSIYWMVGLTLDDQHPMTAADLSHALAARDIETRPFFLGMHDQPALRNAGMARDRRYPVADRLARQGLYLPSGPLLTRETIEHIASAVRGAIQMPGSR